MSSQAARTLALFCATLPVIWATSACSQSRVCTDNIVYGVAVTVNGGDPSTSPGSGAGGLGGTSGTHTSECATKVTVEDGSYKEELECFAHDGDCSCYGATERRGTYIVSATLDGKTQTEQVKVEGDECHVDQQSVTFVFD